ncbi:MarR family transcriptional regulator [Pseudosulfitobacter pseudonitzschiae]|uniref:MarR family transcriptional regulator n=1 Tax=Pseudosulfitobacter pseudonitzschiae TaxID=1402135 RepID=UPI003B7ABE88
MTVNHEILSLDPVPSPKPVMIMVEGEDIEFKVIVENSGMKNVVTTQDGFKIRIIPGDRDLLERGIGYRLYGIASDFLPKNEMDRCREILRRLSYGFHDWAAREVTSRYHRDLKRDRSVKPRKAPVEMISNLLSMENGATVTRISAATGIAQSNVSRVLKSMMRQGLIRIEKHGRESHIYAIDPLSRESDCQVHPEL